MIIPCWTWCQTEADLSRGICRRLCHRREHGCVHIAPGHGLEDYELGLENDWRSSARR